MDNYCLGISLLTLTTLVFFQLCLIHKYKKCRRDIPDPVINGEIINDDFVNQRNIVNNNDINDINEERLIIN